MEKLERYLRFIREAERLKDVLRTAHTSTGRHESTAEHSWRLALLAAVLPGERPRLDMQRVLLMCLVHDLGEAYDGDIPAVAQMADGTKEAAELAAMDKLTRMLPPAAGTAIRKIWEEYEACQTPEARWVKALDKAETIIQHNQGANPADFDYAFNLTYGSGYFRDDDLLRDLRRRKVRTYIVSAIFRRNSIFFRPYGGMWRQALESFDVMFVQNEESKKLLAGLGFDNVIVAGATRVARVAEIAAAATHIDIIDRFKGDKRLFVAGSTWNPDEELLIRLINDNPDVKFIVAPHEMDEGRMARLAAEAKGGTLRYTQCTPHTAYGAKQLLILDTVGILASVYGYATWSYIGGGFGVWIHNTLEAATFGLPVAFGPNYAKFKEARDLVTLGAARPVKNYDELRTWFIPLRDNEDFLQKTSRIAKDYTTRHQGATNIIVKTIFH